MIIDKATFRLNILYSTLAVIHPNEDLNDWSDIHVKQGFTWRSTSVSFGTLNESVMCNVEVGMANFIEIHQSAIRVISVPFEVGDEGVEIVSITDSQPVMVPKGLYELIFQAIPATETSLETYEITFISSDIPQARILRVDEELSPPESLFMEAYPAI